MKLIVDIMLIAMAFAIAACSTASVETREMHGDNIVNECKATYSSLRWTVDGISMDVCGAKGKAKKATNDGLDKLLLEALSRGLQN